MRTNEERTFFSRFKDIVAKKSSKFRIIFIYLFFAFIAAKYVSQRRHRWGSYSCLRCKKCVRFSLKKLIKLFSSVNVKKTNSGKKPQRRTYDTNKEDIEN